MNRPPGQVVAEGQVIAAASIVRGIKDAGVEYIITLPDKWTSESVLAAVERDSDFTHIKVCKEDEGFGISAGLGYCGKRAMLLIQNTGLFDSINALRSVGVEYSLPICAMVGLLDKEPDVAPTGSANYGVRIVEPVLDAMGVDHHLVEYESDAGKVEAAISAAYSRSRPAIILVGNRPVAP